MKKYFLGIIAIAVAISFSAFKAPFSTKIFLLTSDPITASVVSTPSSWSVAGSTFTQCDQTPEDLACFIRLQTSNMSKFYHTESGADILNTLAYAQANTATDARFLEISETPGASPRYKISTIVAKKLVFNAQTQQYDIVTDTAPVIANSSTLGSNDVAYFNARH